MADMTALWRSSSRRHGMCTSRRLAVLVLVFVLMLDASACAQASMLALGFVSGACPGAAWREQVLGSRMRTVVWCRPEKSPRADAAPAWVPMADNWRHAARPPRSSRQLGVLASLRNAQRPARGDRRWRVVVPQAAGRPGGQQHAAFAEWSTRASQPARQHAAALPPVCWNFTPATGAIVLRLTAASHAVLAGLACGQAPRR